MKIHWLLLFGVVLAESPSVDIRYGPVNGVETDSILNYGNVYKEIKDDNRSVTATSERLKASSDAIVSSTESIVSSTESIVSSTESIVSSTESIVSSTESIVSSTESIVSSTEYVVSSTSSDLTTTVASTESESTSVPPATTTTSAIPDIDFDLFKNFITPIDGGVSTQCREDSIRYMDILNDPSATVTGNGWAYKMYDANPIVPPPGLLSGNLKWLGSFESCLEVKAPTFNGKQCLISFAPSTFFAGRDINNKRLQSSLDHTEQLIRSYSMFHNHETRGEMEAYLTFLSLTRCIPSSCSEEDLTNSLTYFLSNNNFTASFNIKNCHVGGEEIPLDSADWAMITIIAIIGLLLAIGTFIDLTIKCLHADVYPEKLVQIFQGFSVYTNTVKLFDTSNVRPDSLTSINGIRFLSMTWVLFSHGYGNFQGNLPVTNLFDVFDPTGVIYGNLAFQAILNGFPSVDSFFFIGSTLLAYITLKELEKQKGGNAKFWTMFYVHRYIRLTGAFAIMIGLTATLLRQFATGPQSYFVDNEVYACQQSWWIHLLYVNNIWPLWDRTQPMCIGQSWYLANDMQYFIIAPIFLYALWKSPVIGLSLSFLGLLAGTITPMVIVGINDFELTVSFMDMRKNFDSFFEVYFAPWCRFQPYICGIIFGYLLHRMRDTPKLKLNPYHIIWIWAVMGAIGALVVYGLYGYTEEYMAAGSMITVGSLAARVAYRGLHRLAWSICLGWVILACTKGAAGPINSILSWSAWIPLARLSYCIYLVHLVVMAYFNSIFTFPVAFSHAFAVYYNLAMLCFSTFAAYILSIGFEVPLAHLERIVFASIGVGKLPKANMYK